MADDAFARTLLAWHARHGRHDLPWQTPDPYKRWLAEVMLQQTTVAAAIPYFTRFTERFPDVATLAAASLDDVLALWAGLGYYARARNLHASARLIMTRHGGAFPRTLAAWTALPGIGPSTAGAIVAFAFGVRAPILDANARRVLRRFHGIEGQGTLVTQRLWEHARAHLPRTRIAAYTQAIMDLGALVCRARPNCPVCPLAATCAFEGEAPAVSARTRPERQAVMMLVHRRRGREVLLLRRPPKGIWGGLWSLPECAVLSDVPTRLTELGIDGLVGAPGTPLRHVFTHFALTITPVPVALRPRSCRARANGDIMWHPGGAPAPGVPAPVKRLLNQFW